MTRCTACRGTYSTVQADGTRYLHACAPFSDYEAGVAIGKNIDRTKWTAQDEIDARAASHARPNARNENAPPLATLQPAIDAVPKTADQTYWTAVNNILATAMVSAGAGATDTISGQPAVITAL